MRNFMKRYKKGTVIILHSDCNYVGCESQEKYTLAQDMDEEELNEMATEFAMETVCPEGWFEVEDEEEK